MENRRGKKHKIPEVALHSEKKNLELVWDL
jgi:hypothetical protein